MSERFARFYATYFTSVAFGTFVTARIGKSQKRNETKRKRFLNYAHESLHSNSPMERMRKKGSVQPSTEQLLLAAQLLSEYANWHGTKISSEMKKIYLQTCRGNFTNMSESKRF